MNLAKPILLAVVAVALSAYAMDCDAMTAPEQAMHCCDSMPCSARGHEGQDCCKTMPAMHAPFVQPGSVHGFSYSPLVLAVLPISGESPGFDSSSLSVAAHCHAPPIPSLSVPLPLRI